VPFVIEPKDVLNIKYLFHIVLYIRSLSLRLLCEDGSYFSHILPLLFHTGVLLYKFSLWSSCALTSEVQPKEVMVAGLEAEACFAWGKLGFL